MPKTRKRETYNYNRTLIDYVGNFNNRAVEGQEVGIEIEVEGRSLPANPFKGWTTHTDGSLRGESMEYVFNGPATRDDVPVRLDRFRKRLAETGAVVDQSYRTSVHVHLNAQDMVIKNIYSQILLYTVFEDILASFCGNERVGNLFCLRAKDAEYYIDRLLRSIRDDNIILLNDQNIRYSAVNSMALFVHGTLEFRSFRGTVDTDLIQEWVNLLLAIKDAATGVFENPISIVQDFSARGPDEFARMVFSREQIEKFPRGWQDNIMEGVRLIQHVAHACDWGPTPVNKNAKAVPTYSMYTTTAQDAPIVVHGGAGNRLVINNPIIGDQIQWQRAPAPRPDRFEEDEV